MKIKFEPKADKHIAYWKKHDEKTLRKIASLLVDIQRSPYSGLGKPEPLKHEYTGWWSRRIDREHRLIYRVDNGSVIVLSCRYHYG